VLYTAADIKPGDRVMVILPAIPEYWLIQAACLRTGRLTVVNISFFKKRLVIQPRLLSTFAAFDINWFIKHKLSP